MRKSRSVERAILMAALLFVASLAGCQKLFNSTDSQKPVDFCDGVDSAPWPWRTPQEGLWGEDPHRVPNFGYVQERRAPKMPSADRYLEGLWTAQDQSFDDALLICQVEIAPRNGVNPTFYRYKLDTLASQSRHCDSDWDSLNAPDALLRFRFRGEYPISLFGPEDHWGFFISIPHIHLAKGDELAVKLWDRDGFLDADISNREKVEYMGEASMKFDGAVPFELKSNFFTMRCNALAADQALARAKWWLDALDGSLLDAENFHPDANQWDFGDRHLTNQVTSDYGKGNFRYPAGFIGWEHPEIQRRIKRLDDIVAADQRMRHDLAVKLVREASALVGTHRLSEGLRDLEITSVSCKGGCVAQAAVKSELFDAMCTPVHDTSHVALAGISKEGVFSAVKVEFQIQGAWESCADGRMKLADNRTKLRLSFTESTVLLWIRPPMSEHALFLKLPL